MDRQERSEPALKVVLPRRRVEVEPVVIRGQIELAHAAGDAGALLDGHQPLVFSQVCSDLPRLREQASRDGVDFGKHRVERLGLDRGVMPERCQQLTLPLELLQDVGLEIGARGDVDDLEQREQRRVMIRGRALAGEEKRAAIQILEPHQRSDALIQRVLVADHGRPFAVATLCTNCAQAGDRISRERAPPARDSAGRARGPAARCPRPLRCCRGCRRRRQAAARGRVA